MSLSGQYNRHGVEYLRQGALFRTNEANFEHHTSRQVNIKSLVINIFIYCDNYLLRRSVRLQETWAPVARALTTELALYVVFIY